MNRNSFGFTILFSVVNPLLEAAHLISYAASMKGNKTMVIEAVDFLLNSTLTTASLNYLSVDRQQQINNRIPLHMDGQLVIIQ